MVDHGDMRGSALVCSDDERLEAALTVGRFVVTRAPVPDDARERIRHDRWTVILVDETTDRATLVQLHGLAPLRRRELFVVSVGTRFESGNRFQAWAESADLVVHETDLTELGRLIGEEMREKNRFYARFKDIRDEPGARLGAHA